MIFDELRQHYSEQPNEVSIETLTQCNARCTFCPYPSLERIGTRMPDELIYRLIDEMAQFEHPFYFSPFKVNEPLLDKRFFDICKTFNEKCPKGYLRIFTNGSTLTKRNIERLAELKNVVHLWISLNEYRAEEYKALMGLDFDHTAKNLDLLHSMEFPHPIVVSRVGMDIPFQYYVHGRWPDFSISMLKKDAWIDFTVPDNVVVPDTQCTRWWELNIAANGVAALCCMDGKAEHGFGDVRNSTLLEIYNHPTLKAWRAGLTRKDAGSPCNGCTY